MPTIIQRFTVSYRYPVCFTRGVFEPSNPALAAVCEPGPGGAPARAVAVLDSGLAAATPGLRASVRRYFAAHAGRLALAAAPLVIPGGEAAKNSDGAVRAILALAERVHLDRHGYLVAAGGGAVLDASGLAAALIHRGVRLVRLPSTLLAEDDAGVGVKNGINGRYMKNAFGTFLPPAAVIDDLDFLATLPDRVFRSGIAEAFKVAIITDLPFFRALCRDAPRLARRERAATERLVRKTAALHLRHIATSGDPFEFGSARPLDFGHWSAHRLEKLSGFRLSHGEAVAIGVALDSTYAALKRYITQEGLAAILGGLSACGLPISDPLLADPALLGGLDQFREHLGGRLCVTLPKPLGSKVEVHALDPAALRRAIALRLGR